MNRLQEIQWKLSNPEENADSYYTSISADDVDWLIAEVIVQRKEGGLNQARYKKEKYVATIQKEAMEEAYCTYLNGGNLYPDQEAAIAALHKIGRLISEARNREIKIRVKGR